MKETNEKQLCPNIDCKKYTFTFNGKSFKCESCGFEVNSQEFGMNLDYSVGLFVKYNELLTKTILGNNQVCELIVANILAQLLKSNVIWNNNSEKGKDIQIPNSNLYYEVVRSSNNNQMTLNSIEFLEKAIELKDMKKYDPKINLIILELNRDVYPVKIDLDNSMSNILFDDFNSNIKNYLKKLKNIMQKMKYINYRSSFVITNRWSNNTMNRWNFNIFYWDIKTQEYIYNKDFSIILNFDIVKIISKHFLNEWYRFDIFKNASINELYIWKNMSPKQFWSKAFQNEKLHSSVDNLIEKICSKISLINIRKENLIINGNFSIERFEWLKDGEFNIDINLGIE